MTRRKTVDQLHAKRVRDAKEKPSHTGSLLNAEVQAVIVKYISAGNYAEIAATAAGVMKSTLESWLFVGRKVLRERQEKAREDKPVFRKLTSHEERCAAFVLEVDKAISTAEVRHSFNVHKAGESGDWKASAWWLQHGPAKRRWHTIEAQEVSGPGGAPVSVDHLASLKTKLDRLAEARMREPEAVGTDDRDRP